MNTMGVAMRYFLFSLLFLVLVSVPVMACTTFLLNDGENLRLCKSYDWASGHGLVISNKRNMYKEAFFPFKPVGVPARWTSQYGSLTFCQYGREFPQGGMNEKGLVVEIMQFMDAGYAPPVKNTLCGWQWIQLQLDCAANVAEAIALAQVLTVSQTHIKMGSDMISIMAPVHYLVADADGNCATIEYVGGKLVIHSNIKVDETIKVKIAGLVDLKLATVKTEPLPAAVLANRSYDDDFNQKQDSSNSCSRFHKAWTRVQEFNGKKLSPRAIEDYAFDSLERVESGTMWQIVYDPKNLAVTWRSVYHGKDHGVRFRASLADFNFSNRTPLRMHDMRSAWPDTVAAKGTVTDHQRGWTDYVGLANSKLANMSLEARDPIGMVGSILQSRLVTLAEKKRKADQEHARMIKKLIPPALRKVMETVEKALYPKELQNLLKKVTHETDKVVDAWARAENKARRAVYEAEKKAAYVTAAGLWSAYPLSTIPVKK